MEEKRSCDNCAFKGCGRFDCINLSAWQPVAQEKKTIGKKVIFESEEEFANYWFSCGIGNVGSHEYNVVKRRSIEHGYIRKSAAEEAEEEYIAYKGGKNCFVAEIVMDKMYSAIQELKSEIARLKK